MAIAVQEIEVKELDQVAMTKLLYLNPRYTCWMKIDICVQNV